MLHVFISTYIAAGQRPLGARLFPRYRRYTHWRGLGTPSTGITGPAVPNPERKSGITVKRLTDAKNVTADIPVPPAEVHHPTMKKKFKQSSSWGTFFFFSQDCKLGFFFSFLLSCVTNFAKSTRPRKPDFPPPSLSTVTILFSFPCSQKIDSPHSLTAHSY